MQRGGQATHGGPPTAEVDGRLLATLEGLLAIQALDVREALRQAAQRLVAALNADKVDVFLHNPATDTLVAQGVSDTPMGRRQRAIGMDRLPVANGGSSAAVFLTGAAHHTGHADAEHGELPGIVHGLGVRSAIAVALEVGGARRGVVEAVSAEREHFTTRDLRFLEAVAGWVGMLAQRAELVERVAAQAAEQGRRAAADELVTILAHDLQNLLTPLRAHLDYIARHVQRGNAQEALRSQAAAASTVARLSSLIDDLLDAARLEQGLFALATQPLDLAELARDTAAAAGGATVPVEVWASGELVIMADPDRLRQALENLVGNAVKHSPAGQPVTVELATEERAGRRWAELTVADRGRGIPPELLPRLFERFAAGPGSAGLGLGLYLARGIAAAHGGTLTVETAPGAGARFTLALPTDGPSPRPAGARGPSAALPEA